MVTGSKKNEKGREVVCFALAPGSTLVFYHPRFKESYRKLTPDIQKKAEGREKIFRQNPFDPRLDTHKLHGKLKKQWSFSIDKRNRILFEFDESDVIFLDIGDHDLYR